MKRSQLLTSVFCFAGVLALILDGKTALSGARMGVDLSIRTVIPSLFPFFVLSICLTNILAGSTHQLLRPLGILCGIPQGAEGILISGFLGGYPVGAQAIGDAYSSGHLSRTDARRLLTFCSNAGPAFLFGIVGSLFSDPSAPFLLWAIHFGSALLVCQISYRKPRKGNNIQSVEKAVSPAWVMTSAVRGMASVCGWVVLFRVIIALLDRWLLWALPKIVQVVVAGFLELSNGCFSLMEVPDTKARFVLCSGMLAWSGLCVVMQTCSVIQDLPLGCYLKGKLLQTLFSLLMSTALVTGVGLPVACLFTFVGLILRKQQKKDSIPAVSGV